MSVSHGVENVAELGCCELLADCLKKTFVVGGGRHAVPSMQEDGRRYIDFLKYMLLVLPFVYVCRFVPPIKL